MTDLAQRATDFARRAAKRAHGGARTLDLRVASPLAVLGYHSVAEPACDPWALAVSPQHFDEHVAVLASTGAVQSLADALRRHRRGRHVRRHVTMAVTFDDGYADNLHTVVPILERYGVPATVFVATRFLDSDAFWWDRLAAIVLGSDASVDRLCETFLTFGLLDALPAGVPARTREQLHDEVYEVVAWRHPDEIDHLLDEVVRHVDLPLPDADVRPLTTDELVELDRHPLITVAVHTANHRRLGGLDRRSVIDEFVLGRQQLETILGRRESLMAYPYGDASRATAAAAKEAGFRHGVTTRRGLVSALDDPLLLPRLQPGDVDGTEFTRFLIAHSAQLVPSASS